MNKVDLKTLLEQSVGQKILFLGKEGTYTLQEVDRFLKKHNLTRVKQIEEGVVATVEHHSLNPVEEMISEDAYERRIPAYKLEEFEKLLSESTNDNEVLMAIKLTNDQARVLRMIENPNISNELFIKLLEMYEWHNEDEDNTDDRSVVIATLTRYVEVTPAEHDQLYSTLTLKRLVREATDPKLLHALISFPNYTFKQKNQDQTSLYEVIATSRHIDETVIRRLLSLHNPKVDMYLAANTAVPLEQLKKFALRGDSAISEALAANEKIDDDLFELLLQKGGDVIRLLLWYQPITSKRFEMIRQAATEPSLFSELGKNTQMDVQIISDLLESGNVELLENLADNHTVATDFLVKLYEKKIPSILLPLAANPSLPLSFIQTLYDEYKDDEKMMHQIASNAATPQSVLRELYERDTFEINKGLAANPSTPIEILDVLKIDTRLRHSLSKNEVFIEYHNNTIVVV